ncbi:MAG: hypothetical protein WC518_01645 [Patescibacteria group bacterium]
MKITVFNNFDPVLVLRRSGYGLMTNRKTGEQSFVRRLGNNSYPRFHAYLKDGFINLHLDQKQPSYSGVKAHSGEYEGEVITKEANRIKEVINFLKTEDRPTSEREIAAPAKGFWSKFFGD